MLVTNPGESDSNKEIKNSRIIDKQSIGNPNFEENPIEEGNREKKHVQTMQTKPLKAGEEKEIHPSEEDKSFVSNVSTAMSERLKNSEEENSSREKANSFDMTHNLKTAEQKVLFQIILYNEKGSEKVKFYEVIFFKI